MVCGEDAFWAAGGLKSTLESRPSGGTVSSYYNTSTGGAQRSFQPCFQLSAGAAMTTKGSEDSVRKVKGQRGVTSVAT